MLKRGLGFRESKYIGLESGSGFRVQGAKGFATRT